MIMYKPNIQTPANINKPIQFIIGYNSTTLLRKQPRMIRTGEAKQLTYVSI